jgi:predicted DCC family thiol-disulfide oxidoreductase YuxK
VIPGERRHPTTKGYRSLVESENAPLLIYDGDCSFCSSSARWISARWNGPQRAVAWQHLNSADLERFGLTTDDVRGAAWWIDPARGKSRGHLAVARALRATGGWPSVAGQIMLVPPFRWLAAGAYPLVARWRYLLPGGTPACRM